MKQRFLLSLIALSSVLAGPPAFAAEQTGVDLGVRLGYALPLGDYSKDNALSKTIAGQVPIGADVGYRFTPNVVVGLNFQYGFGFVPKATSSGCSDCSAHDIRLGIQGQYRFNPAASIVPWLGLGIGYEWLGLEQNAGGLRLSGVVSGPEFLSLEGGADFKVVDGVGVGPFLNLSLGEYSSISVSCPGRAAGLCQDRLDNKALHEWLTLGLRGVYGS